MWTHCNDDTRLVAAASRSAAAAHACCAFAAALVASCRAAASAAFRLAMLSFALSTIAVFTCGRTFSHASSSQEAHCGRACILRGGL